MYMAPEFFTGENPSYGRSIDVFAMGMLFLTMLQAEHGKPLLSPRTGRFNYVFSNFVGPISGLNHLGLILFILFIKYGCKIPYRILLIHWFSLT